MPRNDPEVQAILNSLGLDHLAGRFASEDIDMSLLRSLDEEDLRTLGLTLGQRKKLLNKLNENRVNSGIEQAAKPESRRLTVLFGDLVGFTELTTQIDPDDMRMILQAYHAAARSAARLFGGFIASLQGDGVVMLFGFPATQAASADRALGAAHAMLQELAGIAYPLPDGRKIGVTARIGIASGRAIVGYPDSANAGEPQMVGPVINRAARLQNVAEPGTVVVDGQTQSLASAAAAFSPLPDAELKGFAQKVQVWRAIGGAEPLRRRPERHLVRSAHEVEEQMLQHALRRAHKGEPSLVLLSGDAGIGKSTLASQFADDAEASGLRVLRLSCSALSTHVPLWPIVELLETMLGAASDAVPSVRYDALLQLFGSAPAEESGAVASLLGLRTGFGGMMAPQADRLQLLGALARFLTAARPGPTLIVIEDIHWADATTRELLQRCAENMPGRSALFLATSRDSQDAVWSGSPYRLHVPLPPLGHAAAARVLLDHLGESDLPDPVVRAILARSDGNPLMIEALSRSAGGWKDAGSIPDVEVPSSIYESIAARIETLRAGRRAADVLSVFGEPASEATLALALGVETASLGGALADLASTGIAERFGNGPQQMVRFRHSLYREVCYERLVKSARESLHRSAFAALTHSDSDIATHRPGQLAWHAFEGGEHATAAPLLLTAGEQSLQRSALIEANHFLRQAQASLDRLGHTRKTGQLRLRVLIAQSAVCRATQGIASYEAGHLGRQALELAQSLGDMKSKLIALNGLYTHALVGADYAGAAEWASCLQKEARLSQDHTFGMIGARAAGVVALHTGALAKAASLLREALDGYDEAQHLQLAHVHGYDHAEICAAFLSLALWISGDPAGAERVSAFAVSHSRRIDHKHSLAQALVFRAMLKALAHEGASVLASAREAVDLGRTHGLAAMRGVGGFLVEAGKLMSQPETAAPHALTALHATHKEFEKVNPHNYGAFTALQIAKLHLSRHAVTEADEALCRGEAIQDQTGEIFLRPELMRVRSQVLVARGEAAAAAEMRLAAFAAAEEMGAMMLALRIACDMAEASPSPGPLQRLKAVRARLASEDTGWDIARCHTLLAVAAV